ncbi:hypothetical protein ADL27_23180, partial [Streptomyces sp. NRRL F-6602]
MDGARALADQEVVDEGAVAQHRLGAHPGRGRHQVVLADGGQQPAHRPGEGRLRQGAADLPEPSGALDTRTLSRSLFLRLRELAAEDSGGQDSPERAYVRDTLIELNLPLVRYAAARFRSRNEPMEDIVQVGTIGLIKAIDRF